MVKFRCDLCGSYFATEFLFASHKFRHTIDSDDEEETPSNSSGLTHFIIYDTCLLYLNEIPPQFDQNRSF